ncbi:peptidoglycan DD-metalloendopeptidase family protein [Achromobacter xylosoxidans]|nr:peptidoglycan DD-metalloendopeptidase family protein [Achromobacter xylosoxidans]
MNALRPDHRFSVPQVSALSSSPVPLIGAPHAGASRPRPSPHRSILRRWLGLAGIALLVLLSACGSTKVQPGYYRVQSGDTLYQIARKQGASVNDLVRWNRLSNANAIEVGQVLRVEPPAGQARTSTPTKAKTRAQTTRKPAATSSARRRTAPPGAISLIWPAQGKVTRGYDGSGSNGIVISNSAGTPVVAAAPGTVAYSGSGLRGYGHLVIVKHNASFLSIYAHNRKLLVTEGQRVSQGQKIAEMGNSDSKQVGLYFELRYDGQAVDPAGSLPPK